MTEADAENAALQRRELFDMHCHLGFCADGTEAARELAALGVGAFSNTVTPSEFAAQQAVLAGAANVRVGVGLHPWWVGESAQAGLSAGEPCCDGSAFVGEAGYASDAAAESVAGGVGPLREQPSFDALLEAVARQRFIGEVGLDFSPARAATREAQVAALSQVAQVCAKVGGKVVSLHAVRAVDDVLDVLEGAGAFAEAAGNVYIIHWFSGTSDQLTRARRLGAFFSANPRMLRSKRGRAYVRAIPADRLLLETDLPSQADASWSAAGVRQLLEETLRQLAEARGENAADLRERIALTSRCLLA